METMTESGWNAVPYPPYSPDISPCYYNLFGSLTEFCRRKSSDQMKTWKLACSLLLNHHIITRTLIH